MRTSTCLVLAALGLPAAAVAQDTLSYYQHLPPPSTVMERAAATEMFELYRGDRVDGLNPALAPRLRALVDRFSPILHFQNRSVPRDFRDALDEGPHGPSLIVDTWHIEPGGEERNEPVALDVTGALSRTDQTGETTLRWSVCQNPGNNLSSRRRLLRLIACDGPYGRRRAPIEPEGQQDRVLYFDFAGTSSDAWRAEYLDTERTLRRHIYAHPFIQRHVVAGPAADGSMDAEYRFVIQYWFFYPFNDFVNNHEGDWEHINVYVSTRRAVRDPSSREGLLTESEVRDQILGSVSLDDLVISRLDYYFHHNVMVLDLADLGVYEEAPGRPAGTAQRYLGTGWEDLAVELRRRHGPEATAPSHPRGFVAGAPLSWIRLFSLPGYRDRNSHGTFPFRGIWKRVGPAVVNELVDHGSEGCAWQSALDDACSEEGWKTFQGENQITIVPDWDVFFEGCSPGLPRACTFREEGLHWFWLYLPIRWGYPVSTSVGGGLVPRFNLGQASPMGPAFQGGWNRAGPVPGFPLYKAHVREEGILAPTDLYLPDWGFLNWALQATALLPLPGWPLAVALGEKNPRVFTPQPDAPDRALSLAWGISGSFDRDEALALAPGGRGELDLSWLGHIALRYEISRLTSGIAFEREVVPLSALDSEEVFGRLTSETFSGFLRGSLTHGAFQPFLKLGYGWTSWELDPANDELETRRTASHLIRMPDDWMLGVGVELARLRLPRRVFHGGAGGWDLGLQAEYLSHWSTLSNYGDLGLEEDPGTIRRDRFRVSVTVGR